MFKSLVTLFVFLFSISSFARTYTANIKFDVNGDHPFLIHLNGVRVNKSDYQCEHDSHIQIDHCFIKKEFESQTGNLSFLLLGDYNTQSVSVDSIYIDETNCEYLSEKMTAELKNATRIYLSKNFNLNCFQLRVNQ